MKAIARFKSLPRAVRLGIIGAVAISVSWGSYLMGNGTFSGERGALLKSIADVNGRIATARSRIKQKATHEKELRSFVDRTLGEDLQTVHSELRSRLNRMLEELKLSGHSVNTGEETPRPSPRRSAARR